MSRQDHALSAAIIGAGERARNMIRVYRMLGRPVTGVFSRTREKTYKMVEELGLYGVTTVYENLANMLEHDVSPYIYIASPNNTHAAFSMEAIFHGRHVFTENLMAENVRELASIEEALRQEPRVFMEANTALSSPVLKRLQSYINTGRDYPELGALGMLAITYSSSRDKPKSELGFLKSEGCYPIGAAVRLQGTRVETVVSDMDLDPSWHDSRGACTLSNDAGIKSCLSMSFADKLPSNVVLSFKNGFILVEDFPTALHYDIFQGGVRTRVDLTQDILREYALSPDIFKTPLDISLAVSILDFEAAVAASQDRSLWQEHTNYLESQAVFRLIYEILAHMSVTAKPEKRAVHE